MSPAPELALRPGHYQLETLVTYTVFVVKRTHSLLVRDEEDGTRTADHHTFQKQDETIVALPCKAASIPAIVAAADPGRMGEALDGERVVASSATTRDPLRPPASPIRPEPVPSPSNTEGER